ncbi:sigma-70 family RNA polymerase sigma factor [Spirilliplanes yamanashiensis]|uniref:sigma-70 family RNA polymerase sigma factor n=1 Tax=Spirilliplanes yamanashiensis TaxID=42233 RepID=UPI0023B23A55|nr:sigma-70 family RNA polymerase sigma factor [Spirilliplanes yamanashiensis]MDP9818650.1 RNA polymerase sigma factor for flagellar operon FliA [Spirilliplanes yamanashiensis]
MNGTLERPADTRDLTVAAPNTREIEELVRDNMPVVGHLVRELLSRVPAHIHADDLCSAGFAALLGAARSFDPERGIPFHRYAAVRIRGALLDELRGQDWASRSVRSRARRIDGARQELTAALGRTPTNAEVAQMLGISVDEVAGHDDDVQKAALLSLQGFASGVADEMVTEQADGPEDLLLRREKLGYLHQAVQALPERLREVVTGSFLQERPIQEIAQQLGVTESRISQMRTEALRLLRDGLNSTLSPELIAPARTDTLLGRRRSDYFQRIAENGNLRTRLALTDHHGVPIAVAA